VVPSLAGHRLIIAQEPEVDAAKATRDAAARDRVIAHNGLFATLPDEDRARLASGLVCVPYTRGEIIARQGTPGDGLVLIESGRVSVRLTVPGTQSDREVTQLEDGDFFGELSLMTGELRQASIIALSDVRAWRLDRRIFHEIVRRRPALAEDVSSILARRRTALEALREGLDEEAAAHRMRDTKEHFVDRIRSFFGLDEVS
jgi:CRP-like cAMP-binding protein